MAIFWHLPNWKHKPNLLFKFILYRFRHFFKGSDYAGYLVHSLEISMDNALLNVESPGSKADHSRLPVRTVEILLIINVNSNYFKVFFLLKFTCMSVVSSSLLCNFSLNVSVIVTSREIGRWSHTVNV